MAEPTTLPTIDGAITAIANAKAAVAGLLIALGMDASNFFLDETLLPIALWEITPINLDNVFKYLGNIHNDEYHDILHSYNNDFYKISQLEEPTGFWSIYGTITPTDSSNTVPWFKEDSILLNFSNENILTHLGIAASDNKLYYNIRPNTGYTMNDLLNWKEIVTYSKDDTKKWIEANGLVCGENTIVVGPEVLHINGEIRMNYVEKLCYRVGSFYNLGSYECVYGDLTCATQSSFNVEAFFSSLDTGEIRTAFVRNTNNSPFTIDFTGCVGIVGDFEYIYMDELDSNKITIPANKFLEISVVRLGENSFDNNKTVFVISFKIQP